MLILNCWTIWPHSISQYCPIFTSERLRIANPWVLFLFMFYTVDQLFFFFFPFFWGGGAVMHTVGFQCMIFVTPVLRVLFSLWREFWWIPTKACLCSGCWSTQLANSITLLVIQWEDREADSREREKHEPYQTQALIWCPSIRGITHQSPVPVKNAA